MTRLRPTAGGPPVELLERLRAIREQGESHGLVYGMEFAISYVPTRASSEYIYLDVVGEPPNYSFDVLCSDMGQDRLLGTYKRLENARDRLLDEATRLAGGRAVTRDLTWQFTDTEVRAQRAALRHLAERHGLILGIDFYFDDYFTGEDTAVFETLEDEFVVGIWGPGGKREIARAGDVDSLGEPFLNAATAVAQKYGRGDRVTWRRTDVAEGGVW